MVGDLVKREDLRSVDDGRIEPRFAAVVEEDAVEDMPRRRIEAKGDIREADRGEGAGNLLLDPLDSRDGLDGVAAVLPLARADGQDQGIVKDVPGAETALLRRDLEHPPGDRYLPLGGLCHAGLLVLVDGAEDHRGAKRAAEGEVPDELLLAVLEVERVHEG